MYANESDGRFPRNQWCYAWDIIYQIPCARSIYPEYWTDVNIIFCPSAISYGYNEFFNSKDDLIDCTIQADGRPRGRWCGGGPQQSEYGMYAWDTRVPGDPGFGVLDPDRFAPYTGYYYTGWAGGEHIDIWISYGTWRNNIWRIDPIAEEDTDQDIDLSVIGDAGTFQSWIQDRADWIHQSAPNFVFPDQPYGNGRTPFGTIYRLREGIERFTITNINNPAGSAKAQSDMPVMWDMTHMDYGDALSFAHFPGGANVLYMDGHVEWMRYPSSEHPCTPANTFEWF
jgi:prepilin-type processing-associated H-X9-DG protein